MRLPPLPTLIADPESRPSLGIALSLARAQGLELAAYSLEHSGAGLPERLQKLVRGHGSSEADRAVHNLVRTAFRGTQIPLRRWPTTGAEGENTHRGPLGTPRVVAWCKGSQRPTLDAVLGFAEGCVGPLLLLATARHSHFEEVLVVGGEGKTSPGKTQSKSIAASLQGRYPLWRVEGHKGDPLEGARKDLGPQTLVVLEPASSSLDPVCVEGLEELTPGPVCLVLDSLDAATDLLPRIFPKNNSPGDA